MAKRRKLLSSCTLNQCQNGRCPPEVQTSRAPDDRISGLPDEILVSVLSLLTIKEAAQTSVLSHRWINLWKYTSRLDFYDPKSLDRIEEKRNSFCLKPKLIKTERLKYVHWVNHVLDLHRGHLMVFKVCFNLDISAQNEIDRWLEYALKRNVERLELNLLQYPLALREASKRCSFPDHLLNLNDGLSKEQPIMNCCANRLPKLSAFASLRALSMKCVNVTDEAIKYFLHNCHNLEQLVVVASNELVNLQVSGPSLKLKHLKIKNCGNVKSFKIFDCGLVSLSITEVEDLVLTNVPMLAKLSIAGNWPGFFMSFVMSQVSPFASQLGHLKLKDFYPSNIMGLDEFPQLNQLKKLVINVGAWDDHSLMGLISWIKASPGLEKFELKLWWCKPLKIVRENEKAEKCTLKYLKEIILGGYYGGTSDVELLMYFMENAAALEKIIIDPRCQLLSRRNSMDHHRRNVALKQLKPLVPKHIELVILP